MKLRYRVWLDQGGKVFGKGPCELLRNVEATGSLAEAAKQMKMSYNKAFTLIKDIERRLGFTLLESKRGGTDKGGSKLTQDAMDLVTAYENFVQECDQTMNALYEKHFGHRAPEKNNTED